MRLGVQQTRSSASVLIINFGQQMNELQYKTHHSWHRDLRVGSSAVPVSIRIGVLFFIIWDDTPVMIAAHVLGGMRQGTTATIVKCKIIGQFKFSCFVDHFHPGLDS